MKPQWSKSAEERFWGKVTKSDGCWIWSGSKCKKGYGRISFQGKLSLAHRVSLAIHGRSLVQGLFADHLCKNPSCVNPNHIEMVTPAENVRRGDKSYYHGRTHCMSGKHELTQENISSHGSDGRKRCRLCHNERVKLWLREKRARH